MLAANLPVCQYAGMPAQSNSNNGGSNNNNNSNTNNVKPNNSGSCTSGTIGPNSNNNNAGNSTSGVGLVGGGTSAAAAKNQLEQLNTMREALFSQDGWGCQHVNQDTNWEVPSSPEPTNKDPSAGPTMWKPAINNGTDLWELNLRNGGQPPTQPVQKTPWGHTPSSNLGGTWGEDDDSAESSSVWTGSSNNPSVGTVSVAGVNATAVGGNGPGNNVQWGQTAVGIIVGATSNTTGTVSGSIGNVSTVGGCTGVPGVNVPGNVTTATASGSTGSNWGDSRELNSGGVTSTVTMRGVDPRDPMRGTSATETRDLRLIDQRDPIRGDPRGISGRLNGTSEMWGQHHSIAHNQIPAMNKIVGPGVAVGATVSTGAVVAGGSVAGGIGPGNINSINPVGISGNVNAHWGPSAAVVGPKDVTSMTGKVTGWEEPSPPPQRRNIPNYDDGTSLWGQQSRVPGGGGAHWKDISDPMNRHLTRNTVGNQNTTNTVGGLGNSSVNGLGNNQGVINTPVVGGNANNPISSVGPQGRLSSGVGPVIGVNQHKPDNTLWVHANNPNVSARNTASWGDEVNHNVGPNSGVNWMDEKTNAAIGQLGVSAVGGANSWIDPPPSWNKNQTKLPGGTSGWGASGGSDSTDLSSDWNTHAAIVCKTQPKLGGVNVNISNLNTDVIKQSKQYRILVENGFKKEDVERALINANMNIEEAADLLRAPISMDWRRHEESLGSYSDHSNAGGTFAGRYPPTASQPNMPFPPNMLNSMSGNSAGVSGNNTNLAALNSMQSLPVQKYLNPAPHNVTNVPQAMNNTVAFGPGVANVSAAANATSNSNSQPSAQQLRVLVQQIQLAVHSGYLSSQILSEPLPSSMLVLLYQLLTNIKHLQAAQQSLTRGGNNVNNSQISYAIAKYKQQIQNLQNQINAHQAFILKQKQQQSVPQSAQQHPATHVNNSNMEYMRQHDAISALQGNFSEMNLTKHSGYPGRPNSQSKLINQWKLPEKDLASDSTDFSRAPGTTKQNLSSAPGNTMGPLGLQNDGTWSTGRNIGDGWPDSSTEHENKDWSVAQPASTAAYTDLVQEFEPGKPWKGSQIKSIEDDPSITPGSVARSPLSINSAPKEADIFANPSKSSPTDLTPLSLSSSTWSFNPSSSNQTFQSPQQCAPSELWATSMNKTSRGPPPGLGSSKSAGVSGTGVPSVTNSSSVVTGSANGWMVTGGRGVPNNNSGWNTSSSGWNSTWLLLKNLTTQIDGSTLRTLCMQHGPLSNFHLYLNQGIALCKYATREEANKAQMSLNNCDFGSTTICAESPSESEVQKILQHLPQSSNSVSGSSLTGNGGNGVNNSSNSGSVIGGNNSISSGSGNNIGSCSTVGGSNGGKGNGNMTAHSVVSGTGSNNACGGNAINNACTGSNSSSGNSQSQSGPGVLSSNGGKTSSSSNVASGNGGSNVTSNNVIGSNNAGAAPTWRQTQNQPRPSGRDEYDYISQYVCSIVDD